MYVDEETVVETIELMNKGEISANEAWEILDWFDGDLIEFLQYPQGRPVFCSTNNNKNTFTKA